MTMATTKQENREEEIVFASQVKFPGYKEEEEDSGWFKFGSRLTSNNWYIMIRNVNLPPKETKSDTIKKTGDDLLLNFLFIPNLHNMCGATVAGILI